MQFNCMKGLSAWSAYNVGASDGQFDGFGWKTVNKSQRSLDYILKTNVSVKRRSSSGLHEETKKKTTVVISNNFNEKDDVNRRKNLTNIIR